MTENPSPGALLDEEGAWRLLRAWTPGRAPGEAVRVRLDDGTRASLRIERSGGWHASPAPTDAGARLLDLFVPIRSAEELVIGQLAQGLDGRIATESGDSHYVSGPEDLRRLHRLRALVDAVIVGAGTVELDDPRLTVRRVEGANPARVVLDPTRRLGPGHRVFTDGAAPTIAIHARDYDAIDARDSEAVRGRDSDRAKRHGEGSAPERISLPGDARGRFEPGSVREVLRERGLKRILVEGGGVTVSRFLEAGVLDRLHLTVAPLLMGSGRHGITLSPVGSLDEALRPSCRHFHLGSDVLFDLDLRAPREGPRPREGS